MSEVLRLAHVLTYQRALQVICGLQFYWRSRSFMRPRFTEAEQVVFEEFADVSFVAEYPSVGWWRAPGREEVGTFKAGLTQEHGKVRFAESVRDFYAWKRDDRVVDSGHSSQVLWSTSIRRLTMDEWTGYRREPGPYRKSFGYLIEDGGALRRAWLQPSRLAALEALWFPLAKAKEIGRLSLRHFGERVVNGRRLTEEEFIAAWQASLMADQYPGEAESRDAGLARGRPEDL